MTIRRPRIRRHQRGRGASRARIVAENPDTPTVRLTSRGSDDTVHWSWGLFVRAVAAGARATLILTSGERDSGTFHARLVDIRGDNPPRLVFNTQDGEFEMGANEVARVYLRRWEGMPQGR